MRAALLLALSIAGAASAEQPLSTYPGAVHTRIGNDVVVDGEPYRIAYFTSPDSLVKVAGFFRTEWKKQGYPVVSDGDFVREGVVSAFFTREGLQRMVVVQRHGDQTLGFTVLKDLWAEGAQSAAQLPKLEGAMFAHEAVLRGEAGGTENRWSVVVGTVQSVRDARHAAWLAQSYTLSRESRVTEDGQVHRVLEYARSGQQVVLSLVQLDAEHAALQETWVGSDRPDAVPNDAALRARGAKR